MRGAEMTTPLATPSCWNAMRSSLAAALGWKARIGTGYHVAHFVATFGGLRQCIKPEEGGDATIGASLAIWIEVV